LATKEATGLAPIALPLEDGAVSRIKRALFIVITDYPAGAERVTMSLSSELSTRAGWDVEVKIVCSQLPDSFSKRVLPNNVKVTYGPAHGWHLSFPLLPFRLLFRRYDLMFTTHVYTNALVSLMRRLRLVHIRRLVIRESMSLFDRFGGLKAKRFPLLYKAYGGEDLIIAQTGYMADHVRPWLPPASVKRLRVIPNPVSAAVIDKAAAEPLDDGLKAKMSGRRNILFCGRLVEFKQPGKALEAFRLGAAQDQATQLIFLGGGDLEDDVRSQAAEAGLADRVLFLGFRSNPYPIMAASEIGLLTSANEGFPNVVLEMMACGAKRVVMTPCAGDIEALEGVTITSSHEVKDIASALREALESGEDRSGTYRRAVSTRSTAAFVDQVVG
jgi:glycosyltransferase involved in cell wall biosynthesis